MAPRKDAYSPRRKRLLIYREHIQCDRPYDRRHNFFLCIPAHFFPEHGLDVHCIANRLLLPLHGDYVVIARRNEELVARYYERGFGVHPVVEPFTYNTAHVAAVIVQTITAPWRPEQSLYTYGM